ncbi:MAG: MraY family glycosyltransferase [Bacteroidetes bacterium]|nr:MraY family glycosyltransferase [Bacteroidota bacterium]
MDSLLLIIFIATFLSTFLLVPTVSRICIKFNIFDNTNTEFKKSKKAVLLGGVAIVLGFALPFLFFSNYKFKVPIYTPFLSAALLIIFLNGIADDLLIYKPITKLLTQFIVCYLLVYLCDLGIPATHLVNSFIPASILSIAINSFILIICINSYNLIDGIDGLASSIAFISLLIYGILFFINQSYFFAAMAIGLCGSVFAFLFYNKSPAYIYMGDSGSLFLGLVLGIFSLVFIQEPNINLNFTYSSKLIFSISIIGLPILDLIRLFFVRIYRNKNPFKGDKMHIHHLLCELGLTHNQVTFWLSILHLTIIGLSFSTNTYWILFFAFAFILYVTFVQLIRQLITLKNKMEREYRNTNIVPNETDNSLIINELKKIS